MNNSIAVHSHTDLINIYNNECNNYSESVNNRQYNIDKRNSDNIFNIKHNSLGHNNSDNIYCICNNILLKLIIPVIILAVITLGSIMVKASETDTRPYLKKYYTSVEVTSDDTLWSLEADYNNGLQLETYVFPAFGESDLSEMMIEADAVRPFSFLIDIKIVVSITITGGKVPFPA